MISSIPPEAMERIRDALFRHRKIQAIKIYRTHSNESLADAKAAVESIEAQLRAEHPEHFPLHKPREFLSVLILLGVTGAIIFVIWLITGS